MFVTAARAETPWNFRLTWAEGPDWTTPREYETTIRGSAHEAALDIAGPKFPRVETLTFSVAP